MDTDLEACRSGAITFAELSRRTHPHWLRLAAYLLRKWRAPTWVADETDLVQEMLAAAWIALREWDPERGVPLRSYVIFNSVDKAKKFLHTQRKALRRDDKAPSRHPIPVSALHREGEDPIDVADLVIAAADQDERLEAQRLLAQVPPELVPALREYCQEGSVSEAAWRLLDDVEAARRLGASTHSEAVYCVEEAVGALVDDQAWEILEDQKRREKLGVRTLTEARRAILRVA